MRSDDMDSDVVREERRRRDDEFERRTLAEKLTVIITTSPLPRHPCMLMLDAILASLHRFGGCAGCRTLIVCDGYDVSETLPRWKKGKISAEAAARYEAHKMALHAACRRGGLYANCEILENWQHIGFAHGVRRGVRAALTEYVLVVQHDRPLMRRAPLGALVAALDERPELAHVNLPTGNTLAKSYEHFVASKYALRVGAHAVAAAGLRFVPLLQFYDSTHLSRVSAYTTLFGRTRFAPGDFLEDVLGQRQLAAIRAGGMEAHATIDGMWVLDDALAEVMVSHLDGRDVLSMVKWREFFDGGGPPSAAAGRGGFSERTALELGASCRCWGCAAPDDDATPAVTLKLAVQHRTSRGLPRMAPVGSAKVRAFAVPIGRAQTVYGSVCDATQGEEKWGVFAQDLERRR